METTDKSAVQLKDWTKEEKFNLLQAIKEIGSQDCKKICGYVKSKREDQIRSALDYYKKKVRGYPYKLLSFEKRKRNCNKQPIIPLASWSRVLLENRNFEELQTETSMALRFIAEFEEKPPVCTDKVDFRKLYYMLADALEGKNLPDDKVIKVVFEKCMVETAMVSRSFIRNTSYKQILKYVNMSEKGLNNFPKPIVNNEHATLRHIAVQKNYNPLNIHEDHFKSCVK